jgi:hypothetical protein
VSVQRVVTSGTFSLDGGELVHYDDWVNAATE